MTIILQILALANNYEHFLNYVQLVFLKRYSSGNNSFIEQTLYQLQVIYSNVGNSTHLILQCHFSIIHKFGSMVGWFLLKTILSL